MINKPSESDFPAKVGADRASARRLGRKTLIGAGIGATFGLVYSLIVIDRAPPDGMYVPHTLAGVIVAHVTYLLPWAALGGAIGLFSGLAMSRASKTLLGVAVGAGIGLINLLGLAALRASWSWTEILVVLIFWSLIWAAVGFFSGQRGGAISKTLVAGLISGCVGLILGIAVGLMYPVSIRPTNAKVAAHFNQADIDRANKAARLFGDEYLKCLVGEADRMLPTNMSAQDFSLFVKGACTAEKNRYVVPLADSIAMKTAEPDAVDNAAAVISTANNVIAEVQNAAVNHFIESRSGR